MSNILTCTSDFLPEHNALFVQVDLADYLVEYYLHMQKYAPGTLPEHDEKLKELIACMAVHLTVRPPEESHAWTVLLVAESPYSLFVAGKASQALTGQEPPGYIVGHVLTEHIRHSDVNSFHAQFVEKNGKAFKSYVQTETSEIGELVEYFYQQSEQLPLRIKVSQRDDTVIALAALPDYDKEWFAKVELVSLSTNSAVVKKPMRSFGFVYACDCSPDKLLPYFRSLDKATMDELYGTDSELLISCPRCGKRFAIRQEDL